MGSLKIGGNDCLVNFSANKMAYNLAIFLAYRLVALCYTLGIRCRGLALPA